jgi:hypothetical protein
VHYRAIPLLSAFPFPIPFCSPFVSLYLLGTVLAVIGSCPPRSQVARKLISPFPSPYPYTLHSKIPTPWGLPDPNIHSIRTTSRTWLTRSRTLCALLCQHFLFLLWVIILQRYASSFYIETIFSKYMLNFQA